jgi:hypothetical protein
MYIIVHLKIYIYIVYFNVLNNLSKLHKKIVRTTFFVFCFLFLYDLCNFLFIYCFVIFILISHILYLIVYHIVRFFHSMYFIVCIIFFCVVYCVALCVCFYCIVRSTVRDVSCLFFSMI